MDILWVTELWLIFLFILIPFWIFPVFCNEYALLLQLGEKKNIYIYIWLKTKQTLYKLKYLDKALTQRYIFYMHSHFY